MRNLYFSCSIQRLFFILLEWFVRWEVKVVVQLLFFWVLLPGFVQNSA